MFLFSDSQIKLESFVEDINNLLNSGEVPNLFPYEERAAVLELCRCASKREGLVLDTPTELWNFFVDKTKANLHIVLCFSPIGDALRCAVGSPNVVCVLSICKNVLRTKSLLLVVRSAHNESGVTIVWPHGNSHAC
jgi:hypothetical protein